MKSLLTLAGLSLVVLLAGCTGTPRWGAGSKHPSAAQFAAVMGRMDRYVYFPGYEIYFNRTKDQYVFRSGGTWIAQKEPPSNVMEVALLASPAVAMDFDDAPARHHATVVRTYPRFWGRPGTITASAP